MMFIPLPGILLWALIFGLPALLFHVLWVRRERDSARLMSYLAATASRGYPLAGALDGFSRGVSGGLRWKLAAAADAVAHGVPLSVALQRHRAVPNDYLELIRSGEASGRLPEVFRVLGRRGGPRRQATTRSLGFAMYPLFLCTMLSGVGFLNFTLIYPKFREIFRSFEMPLPWIVHLTPTIWQLAILTSLVLTALIAFPIGVATAVYLEEYDTTETRFRLPQVLRSHGIQSGISVVIGGRATGLRPISASSQSRKDISGFSPLSQCLGHRRESPEC